MKSRQRNGVIGPYTLLQKLSVGSHGTTYYATLNSLHLTPPFVLKTQPLSPRHRDDILQVLPRCSGVPNLAECVDYFIHRHKSIWVYRFIPGQDALEFFWAAQQNPLAPDNQNDPNQVDQVRQILFTLLQTIHLMYAKNIVHGDLHLRNIRITPDNIPVLIDFGSMQWLRSHENHPVAISIDPEWSPPETLETQRLSPTADYFAFSVLTTKILHPTGAWISDPALKLLLETANYAIRATSTERAEIWQSITPLIQANQGSPPIHSISRPFASSDVEVPLLISAAPPGGKKLRVLIPPKSHRNTPPLLIYVSVMIILGMVGFTFWFRSESKINPFLMKGRFPTRTLSRNPPISPLAARSKMTQEISVLIQANPWAMITINGKPLGSTPVLLPAPVSEFPMQLHATYRNVSFSTLLKESDLVQPSRTSPAAITLNMKHHPPTMTLPTPH